jgi:hypothetical protein
MQDLLNSLPLVDVLKFSHSSVISKYAKQENYSLSIAEKDFKECLKFLYLCVNSNGFICSPSNRIDKVWHNFILFTRDYKNFCDEYLGVFIHHNPTDGADALAYMNTRELAEIEFGDLDPDCWPIIDATCCNDGCCQHSDRA